MKISFIWPFCLVAFLFFAVLSAAIFAAFARPHRPVECDVTTMQSSRELKGFDGALP